MAYKFCKLDRTDLIFGLRAAEFIMSMYAGLQVSAFTAVIIWAILTHRQTPSDRL